MPGPKVAPIVLSEDEYHDLMALIRAHTTPQHLSFRAQLIVRLAAGQTTSDVAHQLGTTRVTVRRWRRHWMACSEASVLERLQDAPRPGTPATFSAEQWCQIMALACQPPQRSERPISDWTPRELADEAIKRGIVETISTRHVGRFLKSGQAPTPPEPVLAQRRARCGPR